MPEKAEKEDFLPYTCGLSVFVRRKSQLEHGWGEKRDSGVQEKKSAAEKDQDWYCCSGSDGGVGVEGDIEDVVRETGMLGRDGGGSSMGGSLRGKIDWIGGKGIQGGWDCIKNGDCSFLKGGAERGW